MFDTLKEAKAWVREHSVMLEERVMQRRPYTTVVIQVEPPEDRRSVPWPTEWGTVKYDPSDPLAWSDKVGIARARGRAEAELARRLVKPAHWAIIARSTEVDQPDVAEAALQAEMQGAP